MERTPIGLLPRYIWVEKRLEDVKNAIERYQEVDKKLPMEWILELLDLIQEVDRRRENG